MLREDKRHAGQVCLSVAMLVALVGLRSHRGELNEAGRRWVHMPSRRVTVSPVQLLF